MRTALLALLALALAAPAGAATDLQGGDLICGPDATASFPCADGDTLSGTYVNVRLFKIESGVTVFVGGGVPFEVFASTADIEGTLDAAGSGRAGGSGGTSGSDGKDGRGSGAGGKGFWPDGAGGSAGYGGAGDIGLGGGTGGSAGSGYGADGLATVPFSDDDIDMGSGGGGGASCGNNCGSTPNGGAGGSGGGSVYIEASSMTVGDSALIDVSGDTGGSVFQDPASLFNGPGAGGGGSGGSIGLRVKGPLNIFSSASLWANGGSGGGAAGNSGCSPSASPASGGGGGRIKIIAETTDFDPVSLSTSGGSGGVNTNCANGFGGSDGVQFFGTSPSRPGSLSASQVNFSSITWSWAAAPGFGDGSGASQRYRLFVAVSTAVAPPTYDAIWVASATAGATSLDETGLTPNTTYVRLLTAYTDYGDGNPTYSVSTVTLASSPGGPSFSAVTATGLTFSWTSGSPANPTDTAYKVERTTDPAFNGGIWSTQLVAVSSSPASLTPNTTYYFRARAVDRGGRASDVTAAVSTITAAATPASFALGNVYVSSVTVTWSPGTNPSGTSYLVQASTDNFFSVSATSQTANASATLSGLSPGQLYFFKVAGLNAVLQPSAYTAVVSTTAGNLADTTAPAAPGVPVPDRQYSYDGKALFAWGTPVSAAGIFDYNLLVGSTPGGSDFFSGSTTTTYYSAAGLASGKTYYATVRARTNAGVYGPFSTVSLGVPVYVLAQAAAFAKAYAWPNPGDPAAGPINIGFTLTAPASVRLRIFTLQGNLAYQESRDFDAGNQVWPWTGRNGSGAMVEPGGYVCVLEMRYSSGAQVQKFKLAVRY